MMRFDQDACLRIKLYLKSVVHLESNDSCPLLNPMNGTTSMSSDFLMALGTAMRVMFAAILLLSPFIVVAAPEARASQQGERIAVTFVNPGNSKETFWTMVSNAMAAAAEDLNIDLDILYAERNRIRMRELGLKAASKRGSRHYLVIVNEEQYGSEILSVASANGVKTIMLLNDLTDEQKGSFGKARSDHGTWLGSITPDNYLAGREMASAVIRAASSRHRSGQPVRVFALGGDRTTPASIDRLAGLNSALSVDAVLDRVVYANWKADESYRLTQRYLEWSEPRDRVAHAFWAANDPIAFGAINALRERGYEPGSDVFVAGLNWSSDAVGMVERGEMELTHGGHFLGGAWVMVLLRDYHDGYDFAVADDPDVRFPMMAIDQSNVKAFKRALGDEDWGKIDFAAFTKGRIGNDRDYDFTLSAILRQFR